MYVINSVCVKTNRVVRRTRYTVHPFDSNNNTNNNNHAFKRFEHFLTYNAIALASLNGTHTKQHIVGDSHVVDRFLIYIFLHTYVQFRACTNQQQISMRHALRTFSHCFANACILTQEWNFKTKNIYPMYFKQRNSWAMRVGWLVGTRYLSAKKRLRFGGTFSWHRNDVKNTVLNVPSPMRRWIWKCLSMSGICDFRSATSPTHTHTDPGEER